MTWFRKLLKNRLKAAPRFPVGARRSWGRRLLFTAVTLVLLLFLLFSTAVSQPSPGGYWYDVRSLEGAELGVNRPVSLAYSPTAGAFFLLGEGEANGATATLVRFTLYGDPIAESRLATAVPDPLNAAFHAPAGELLFLDPARQELARLEVGAEGDRPVSGQTLRQFNIQAHGLVNPQGVALAGDGSRLFVLDAAGPAIVTIQADEADQFASGTVTPVSLPALDHLSLRGLAFHPDTGRFFVSSPAERKVYELTAEGHILSVFDLASLNLGDPQGLLLAPSGDPTDEPAQLSLYMVDRGLPGRSGQVVELSLTPPVLGPMPEATILASLVQIIDTSIWSPPSPDPAGIDFHLGLGRLIISDSEVEEMDIYEGKNIFLATTAGNLTGTCDTTEFTNEPTGTAVNPNNGHIFFTADGQDEVFEVGPGQDGQYCTGDDTLTTFDTQAFNSFDPEGIAYGAGRLMIADGEGTQVYVVDPGNNGLFDGVPPAGDDQVTNFDTLSMGLRDPEGIGFHWDNGTIFINSRIDDIIVETNFSGTVLNVYDIEAIPILNAGGLGVGPSSQGGPMSVYIAARGVDNGADPNENDGKIYEISLAGPLPTPTSTSGPSPTPTNTPSPSTNPLYLSLANGGPTTVGTLTGVRDEDIIAFDGSVWTMFFDGSDVGVSADLNAFYIMDGDTLLLTFSSAVNIPPIGTVNEFDIVRFDATSLGDNTAGTFSLYFDGADVGLSDGSAEDIDALDVLPNGDLLISTTGTPVVPGVSDGRDEDILRFAPTSLGANTSGTWSMYFDGSDVGLSGGSDIDAVTVAANGDIFLSTADPFAVPGVSGDDEDVFVCSPTSLGDNTACTYSPVLYFDGSTWGLADDDVDGINRPAIAPPATPTPTPVPPTNTPTPVPPTATNTPTPVPPTATATPPLPTDTSTPVPPTATNTPTAVPPTATDTSTPVPPTATNTPTPVPPTATATPPLPTNTPTTAPPSPTATTVPSVTPTPGRTRIPTATSTPAASATPGPSATPPPPSPGIYLSLANGGPTTVGNLSGVRDEDIIALNGTVWSMVFDGSDVGVQSSVDAFHRLDADTILFSLARAEVVGSLGIVDSFDIIQFDATSLGDNTAGTFSLYFDGSDVGLNTSTENVDAFDVLSDGTLLFSFAGNALLPGISGVTDEDLLRFTPTSLGANTSGTWSMYFDGSDVGLGGNGDIDATTVGSNGNIYLSTLVAFSLPGVSGENEDVFVCTPTSLGDNTACTYLPALYFDGSVWGLGGDNIDAIGLP